MTSIKRAVAAANCAVVAFFVGDLADLKKKERGSLTLEQIIITVALAIVAIAAIALVVAAINKKAGELPL